MEIYIRVDRNKPPVCTLTVCSLLVGLVLIGHGLVDKDTGILQIVFGSIFMLLCVLGTLYSCFRSSDSVVEQITVHSDHAVVNPMMIQPTEKSDGRTDCCVCMDAGRDIAFIPCGHSVCASCNSELTLCPVCRSPIADRLRLY